MIEIKVNGQNKKINSSINLADMLKDLHLPTELIAIELNKKVVRKRDWNYIKLAKEDVVEIIHFVGGG